MLRVIRCYDKSIPNLIKASRPCFNVVPKMDASGFCRHSRLDAPTSHCSGVFDRTFYIYRSTVFSSQCRVNVFLLCECTSSPPHACTKVGSQLSTRVFTKCANSKPTNINAPLLLIVYKWVTTYGLCLLYIILCLYYMVYTVTKELKI